MSLPRPYYDEAGITIYHGDCREILPMLEAEAMITDPVWPNCEHIFPGINASELLGQSVSADLLSGICGDWVSEAHYARCGVCLCVRHSA